MQERTGRITRVQDSAIGVAYVQPAPPLLWQSQVQPYSEANELFLMKQNFPEVSWHQMCSIYVREACLIHAFVEAVIHLA